MFKEEEEVYIRFLCRFLCSYVMKKKVSVFLVGV